MAELPKTYGFSSPALVTMYCCSWLVTAVRAMIVPECGTGQAGRRGQGSVGACIGHDVLLQLAGHGGTSRDGP